MNKLTLACAGLGALMASSVTMASDIGLSEVDWDKLSDQSSFLFAPLIGTTSNRGVFWYRDIYEKLLGPTPAGLGIHKITLRAMPNSHEDGTYTAFVDAEGTYDYRVHLMPDNAVLCEPTQALQDKLGELQIYYNITTYPGNYPGLCSLAVKYDIRSNPSAEQELLDFFSANKGMQVRYQIGTDGQPGVYMNTPGIVSNLVEQGVLTQDANDGSYKGELYKLAFYSSQLNYPLFRDDKSDTPLAFEDWKRFVDLLLISTDGVASLSAEQAADMVEVVPPSNGSVLIDVNH